MCHHRRLGDWLRRLFDRLRQRMEPVWDHAEVGAMTPQEREAHFMPAKPTKAKAPRKAKAKRSKKK